MSKRLSRRQFISTSAAAGGAVFIGYHLNPTQAVESKSPNQRLNIAAVGATGRAGSDITGVASQNIIAIADVDSALLEKGSAKYPGTRKYEDFRVMLEKEEGNIDAVVVGTADHTHAPAAAMALRMKKHVYCEKPLTHTVYEARVLANLAKKNNLATQMGTQIHAGSNYRRVVELVESGCIGEVREVHVWNAVNYSGAKFTTNTHSPANLNWDLWLGPAPKRHYSEGVHPRNWRRFWDFGTGGLGDFGCHYMDLPFWALKLKHPTSISASGPPVLPDATTAGLVVEYKFPARGQLPAVKMTWYDGGKKPALLSKLTDSNGKPLKWGSAQLFVGSKGMIISNYSKHILLPTDKFAEFERPEPTIPDSIGHHAEWLNAIKTGGPTTCNFDYSGALTEAVLLGVVSYRSGQKLQWDAENLKVTNSPEAQQYVHKEYRKGWTL